ncbi:MAG: hypothetical protein E7266_06820 [Lachnospiraceae bacterium]|nr:hypothetical protein [Lachnospiraceae bacterium]
MRRLLTKFVALGLVIAMTGACFAGCNGNKKNKPITLTVYSELANVAGEQVGWSAKILLEKFNVKINIITAADGVFETRMESGDLGDIVVFGGESNYQTALEAGLLYDWEEENLIQEHGAYINEHMKDALNKNRELTSTITKGAKKTLYGFGFNVATSSENHDDFLYTWDLRWDLYKQLNYPEMKNLDDLIGILEDMKEICPTDANGNPTYGISLWPDWDGDMVMYVKSLATAYYGYDEFAMGLHDPITGTYYDALQKDGPYLEMLKFFNKLYQKDLLDPNSMTQTYDEAAAKLKAGGAFWSIFNYSGCLAYNTDAHLAENKMMCSIKPEEASPIVYGMSTVGGNRVWSIGANTEYPELCMDIINWLCTPEGYMTYLYGPKDLCWYYDDEGYTQFTEFGKKVSIDRSAMMEGDYAGLGSFNDGALQINNTTWSGMAENPDSNGEVYNWQFWKSQQVESRCEVEKDWRERYDVKSAYEYFEKNGYTVSPATSFALAKKDKDLDTIWEAVKEAVVDGSWKAIYAETDAEFDRLVDEMIKEAKGYGYDTCVEWAKEQSAIRYQLEEEARK